jgi:Protein of unknown function (DUF3168)
MGTPQDARIPIQTAIMTVLKADAELVALVAPGPNGSPGIYFTEAPQGARKPYVVVGEASEIPFHTMGATWGSDVTVMTKAVIEGGSDYPGLQILSRIRALLEGAALVVPGFLSTICEFESSLPAEREMVSGIVVRHVPAIYRVKVHEAAA